LTQLLDDGTEEDLAESDPKLRAYVASAVRRHLAEMRRLDRRRARRDAEYLRERLASVHTWMDPEAQWMERECQALYDKTLASLPPRCRAAFVAVREEERSYAEAAKELGISVKMVAKRITQAQRVFRLALLEYGIVPPRETRPRTRRIAFEKRVGESTDERVVRRAQREPEASPI
jgi:RNA polymerase sigma factor (sigma-70 family)